MKNIGKKILIFFFIILLIIVGYGGYRFSVNPLTTYPYPYAPIKVDQNEIQLAQEADIIILGDSAGVALTPYLELFKERTAQSLKEPVKIYNWARAGENLAHALAKIKSLKKMPLLFIYHGGLDELDRARFNPKYLETIGKNIQLAKNEEVMSTILSLPVTSRLIYHPHPHITLDSSALPYPKDLSLPDSLKSLEYLYTFYKWEAREFTNSLRLRDARLWFIPQAYNLMERPSRNCITSTSRSIEKVLTSAEGLLAQKKSKEAISMLLKFIRNQSKYAQSYYILGKAFLSQGQNQRAKKAFYQALILDCGLKRSNPLMLKILMEEVEKKNFEVIDFNRLVTGQLGHRLMFESLRMPQRFYYERLLDKLTKKFEELIRTKE